MSNFRILTPEEVYPIIDKKPSLDFFKKYSPECQMTDFTILLGGYEDRRFFVDRGFGEEKVCNFKNLCGYWWLDIDEEYKEKAKLYGRNWLGVVRSSGNGSSSDVDERYLGVRPAISYSLISSYCTKINRVNDGILKVEYGEYPQTIVTENIAKTLERLYSNGKLKQTGKAYTTDSININERERSFNAESHIEYVYKGKKYIRFIPTYNSFTHPYDSNEKFLSNGNKVKWHDVCWIEVEPIKWFVDEKADIAFSEKLLFSGIQFKADRIYNGDFNSSDIKKFIDKFFSREIDPNFLKNIILEEPEELETYKESKAVQELRALLKSKEEQYDNRRRAIDWWIDSKKSLSGFQSAGKAKYAERRIEELREQDDGELYHEILLIRGDILNGTNNYQLYIIEKKLEELKRLRDAAIFFKKREYTREIEKVEAEYKECQAKTGKR